MANWTYDPTPVNKDAVNGGRVVIRFLDDAGHQFTRTYVGEALTQDNLKSAIRRELESLSSLDALPATINIDAPDDPKEPTAMDLYGAKLLRYRELQGVQAFGIDVSPDLAKLKDELIRDYDPDFSRLFRGILG